MDLARYAADLKYLIPEMALLAVAVIAMFVHLFGGRRGRRGAGLVVLAGLVGTLWLLPFAPLALAAIYSGALTVDTFSLFVKIIILLSAVLSVVLSFRFFDAEGYESGEVYYLLLFAVIGMLFTASATDLISFYVSFELFAICSYILAGIFKKEIRSAEAGLKYFVLGALSSAIMLLGMALVYGVSGATAFSQIAAPALQADQRLFTLGMVLFFIGLFFKVAAVPFHMWTPDVYEGAPTPLVAFLSTAPKAAAFAVFIRLLSTVFGALEYKWTMLFTVVSIVTMFWGNLAALGQHSLKRMLAYSSIAHAGYMLIGLAALGSHGAMAVLFYLFAYLFMNTAAFGLILFVQKKSGFGEEVDDLNGLAQKAPLVSAGIIVLLLSLTGIPPTAGFIGKYYLLSAAVGQKMYLLAVAGALNSVISLFYYFRIGRAMFMESDRPGRVLNVSVYVRSVLFVCIAALLYFGLAPGGLINFATLVAPR